MVQIHILFLNIYINIPWKENKKRSQKVDDLNCVLCSPYSESTILLIKFCKIGIWHLNIL